jgi:hypothetical protein
MLDLILPLVVASAGTATLVTALAALRTSD